MERSEPTPPNVVVEVGEAEVVLVDLADLDLSAIFGSDFNNENIQDDGLPESVSAAPAPSEAFIIPNSGTQELSTDSLGDDVVFTTVEDVIEYRQEVKKDEVIQLRIQQLAGLIPACGGFLHMLIHPFEGLLSGASVTSPGGNNNLRDEELHDKRVSSTNIFGSTNKINSSKAASQGGQGVLFQLFDVHLNQYAP